MLPTVLVLISAVSHALMTLLIKFSGDKLVTIGILASSAAIMISPLVFFVDVPTGETWLWLAISIVIHVVYSCLVASAYQHHDLSVAYPLSRGAGVVVSCLLAALFLGESLTWLDLTSVALVVGGILSISGKPNRSWLICGLIGLSVGTYTIIDAQGSRAQTWTFIVYLFLLYGLAMGVWAYIQRQQIFWQTAKKQWRQGFTAGAVSLISYGSILAALNLEQVSSVVVLRETSLVFGAIFSVFLLKEIVTRVRWFGIFLICAGAIFSQL